MIKSMTGYGRGEFIENDLTVTVEIKSVNHRFFECQIKAPRQFSFLEDKLKSYIQSRVNRGKLDVFVSYSFQGASNDTVEINEDAVKGYIDAFKTVSKKYKIKNDLTVATLARQDGIFSVSRKNIDEELATSTLLNAAQIAVDCFIEAREVEGEKLVADVLYRADNILSMVEKVEELSPKTVAEYKERLEKKIREVLDNKDIDDQRIITEVAIFADKVAVDEETVRLRTHIGHLKELLASGEVVGKKLDFIVQEMNREANTTGSKCQDVNVTKIVVDIKSEIEKIREQIQNIE